MALSGGMRMEEEHVDGTTGPSTDQIEACGWHISHSRERCSHCHFPNETPPVIKGPESQT